jgi:hypothetical protein
MKRILALILILATFSMVFAPPANAATQAQIDASTAAGVAWLAGQQFGNSCPGTVTSGCWAPTDFAVGTTAMVVWKLEIHAVLQGLSPFDPAYAYSTNVVNGLNYLFANAVTHAPSSGVYFREIAGTGDMNYVTALGLIAVVSGADSNRLVVGGPLNGMTYQNVAAGVVSFLAWAQRTTAPTTGGWWYDPIGNPPPTGGQNDNSVSGHVVMGLLFAETPLHPPCGLIGGFGLTIPPAVKTNLNTWITYIQDASGGSHYTGPTDGWVNTLRTGHLLQQMAFVGDTSSAPRVQSAVAYLVSHWNDLNQDPGWKGAPFPSPGPSNYQATLMVMKGLVALGIDRISGIDWFNDITDAIVAQQLPDGSWPVSYQSDTGRIRSTTWALLTLERAAPCARAPPAVGGTVAPPSLMTGVLALLPWILMAFAAVGAGAYAMRRRYASPLLARIR